jgi:hypothetical protein
MIIITIILKLFTGRAIAENFIFTSLAEEDIVTMINAMEILNIRAGENVITQGLTLLFFSLLNN